MKNNNDNSTSSNEVPFVPQTVTIRQFNVPLGLKSVMDTTGNATVSQIISGSVTQMPTATMLFPAPVTHAEKSKKFNSLNFKH